MCVVVPINEANAAKRSFGSRPLARPMQGSDVRTLQRLPAEAGSLGRERPILFYCRTGSRSSMAADAFRRAGFDAYNLDGGLVEWTRRGYALEPEDGTVADH